MNVWFERETHAHTLNGCGRRWRPNTNKRTHTYAQRTHTHTVRAFRLCLCQIMKTFLCISWNRLHAPYTYLCGVRCIDRRLNNVLYSIHFRLLFYKYARLRRHGKTCGTHHSIDIIRQSTVYRVNVGSVSDISTNTKYFLSHTHASDTLVF